MLDSNFRFSEFLLQSLAYSIIILVMCAGTAACASPGFAPGLPSRLAPSARLAKYCYILYPIFSPQLFKTLHVKAQSLATYFDRFGWNFQELLSMFNLDCYIFKQISVIFYRLLAVVLLNWNQWFFIDTYLSVF